MLARKYDFKEIEKNTQDKWEKDKERIKSSIKYTEDKELFSFLEGPPTANAPPGLHHVEVRVFKDLFCRFKFMQGYAVPRKGGWDCHGLPVEVQVERKLGLETKKDVVEYGVEKFIDEAKEMVFSSIEEWNKMTNKMAYWVDLENPYVTLETPYMESVWWSLKELHKKNLLYEGEKVIPYCPRCETPLSSHEVAQGYKDVEDPAIFIKFKAKDEENVYYLAWTTTPWTLTSNISLAVNKDMSYAYVKDLDSGQTLIMAEELVEKIMPEGEIQKTVKGAELEHKQYEPLFDYYKNEVDKGWIVVLADYVSAEDGSGIVHQAPAFGELDYDNCKAYGLPFIQPVDESGKFTDPVTDFKGMFVKDADKQIIEKLDKEGKLFHAGKVKHTYPFCWRCNSPLLYYALKSWFIKVSDYRDQLVKHNEKINWFPGNIKEGRFGNWLEGAKDWALSRNKFWGTPLPIWQCECGNDECIGSIKELAEKATTEIDQEKMDLHKDHVDKIKLKCECGKEMTRVPYVIDCWYDSGSAPFAQLHYPFENKELFEKYYPYDFIAEAIDQTRGWFYTLHVLGVLLFDSNAYNNVVCAGHTVDEKGEKMSKSKGNIIKPDEIFDAVGVDAVRIAFCQTNVGAQKRFGIEKLKKEINPFFNVLWNTAVFTESYLTKYPDNKGNKTSLKTEDAWIISKVNTLVKECQESYDKHDYHHVVAKTNDFFANDFSRWYIKLIRPRTNNLDEALLYTLRYVWEKGLKTLAPIAPYITEEIYSKIVEDESIHFTAWPKVEDQNDDLERDMVIVREITQTILYAREKMKQGVRWPIKKATIETEEPRAENSLQELDYILQMQTNVKEFEIKKNMPGVKVTASANKTALGKEFGKKMPKMVAILETKNVVAELNRVGNVKVELDGSVDILTKDHFNFERVVPENLEAAEFKFGTVYLDKETNDELLAEGFSRELMRHIQDLRKKAKLNKEDRISLEIKTDMKDALTPHLDTIKDTTGAESLEFVEALTKTEQTEQFKVKEKEFEIGFNKI